MKQVMKILLFLFIFGILMASCRTVEPEPTRIQEPKPEPDSSTGVDFNTESNGIPTMLTDVFFVTALSESLRNRITGVSYPVEEPDGISYEELRYVHVLHYNQDHEIKEGELICNQLIAEDLIEIFQQLFEAEYPIEQISLIEEYAGDDALSMAANNTSCFNYRMIVGSSSLSNHSLGLAIDINPLYNPCVSKEGVVQPVEGECYANRSGEFPYKIEREDLCYRLFTEHGFIWGGDWENPKDYQHFEYVR